MLSWKDHQISAKRSLQGINWGTGRRIANIVIHGGLGYQPLLKLSGQHQTKEHKVEQAVTIFVSGIGGVFVGMALLYIGILISAQVAKRLESKKGKE